MCARERRNMSGIVTHPCFRSSESSRMCVLLLQKLIACKPIKVSKCINPWTRQERERGVDCAECLIPNEPLFGINDVANARFAILTKIPSDANIFVLCMHRRIYVLSEPYELDMSARCYSVKFHIQRTVCLYEVFWIEDTYADPPTFTDLHKRVIVVPLAEARYDEYVNHLSIPFFISKISFLRLKVV